MPAVLAWAAPRMPRQLSPNPDKRRIVLRRCGPGAVITYSFHVAVHRPRDSVVGRNCCWLVVPATERTAGPDGAGFHQYAKPVKINFKRGFFTTT
jgi:hypothetical protein